LHPTLLEAAIETRSDAIAAVAAGAGRLELCAALSVGGLTPDVELVRAVRAAVSVPLNVLILPEPNRFVLDEQAEAEIARDIARLGDAGASGVVIGALTADWSIDEPRVRRLVALARPLTVTFHRAFDRVTDLPQQLERLIELGVDRVLTSGGAPTALEGLAMLARLVEGSRGRIVVLAGGSVRPENAAAIVAGSGVGELHVGMPPGTESSRISGVRKALGG
jgi:copper homeostasis protein